MAVLALLAVLSLAVAASTLDRTAEGTGGSGIGDTEGTGVGDTNFGISIPDWGPNVDNPLLSDLVATVFALLVVVGSIVAVVAFYLEYGLRGLAGVVVASVVLAFLIAGFAGLFEGLGSSLPSVPEENNSSLLPSGGSGDAGDEAGTPSRAPPVLAGVFVLALLAGGLLLVRATGDDARSIEPAEPEPPEAEQLGRVAGEAADRIVRGAVTDNEVYRAWREMTELLDVANPAANTPAEFADAAVDAGLDPEDVDELTALFAEIRYGDRPVTEDREERAVAALRRIEEAYA